MKESNKMSTSSLTVLKWRSCSWLTRNMKSFGTEVTAGRPSRPSLRSTGRRYRSKRRWSSKQRSDCVYSLILSGVSTVIEFKISTERLCRLHTAAALHGGGDRKGEERREGGLAERNPGAAARHGENLWAEVWGSDEPREKRHREVTEITGGTESHYCQLIHAEYKPTVQSSLFQLIQIEEKEMYAQRQALLKEIESVRSREIELTQRMEAFDKWVQLLMWTKIKAMCLFQCGAV